MGVGPCSTFKLRNPFSTMCGFGIGGAAAECDDGSWMTSAKGFRTPAERVRASFVSDDFSHWA